MFEQRLCMKVRNEERDVVSLDIQSGTIEPTYVACEPTLTGLRRKIKNDSARCCKNLVNLWTRIRSISSACLMEMLTRTLFTDVSI